MFQKINVIYRYMTFIRWIYAICEPILGSGYSLISVRLITSILTSVPCVMPIFRYAARWPATSASSVKPFVTGS